MVHGTGIRSQQVLFLQRGQCRALGARLTRGDEPASRRRERQLRVDSRRCNLAYKRTFADTP